MLDRAEWYELDILFKRYNESIREQWEQTRLISYVIAQTQTKKKLKLSDILEFEWDKKEEVIEDKEEFLKRLKMFENQIETKKDFENEVVTFDNLFGNRNINGTNTDR